jgi:hypothetical protein
MRAQGQFGARPDHGGYSLVCHRFRLWEKNVCSASILPASAQSDNFLHLVFLGRVIEVRKATQDRLSE